MKRLLLLVWLVFSVAPCFAGEVACDRGTSFAYEVPNFHLVAPGIMRGSQPSDEALAILKSCYGTKTVLSLRDGSENSVQEQQVVEGLGMRFVNIPMSGGVGQSPQVIEEALAVIADKKNQPVFVHCAAGKDRTGLIIAAYRIRYDRWSFQDALNEMLMYGYDRTCCKPMEDSLREWTRQKIGEGV